MGELVCAVVAGCLLAAPPPLTLDGRELSPVVEVWTLQEPAAPITVSDDESVAGRTSTRHPILIGAVAGGIGGCLYGAAMGTMSSDVTPSGSCVVNALAFSGIVAGTARAPRPRPTRLPARRRRRRPGRRPGRVRAGPGPG